VAERSFSTVMQLVTGCTVSFAESVDTVVVNLREIAPRGFLGVPRIWEKMQQSVLYRVKDATPFQRRVFEACLRRGRSIAERRLANGGDFASVSDALMFRLLSLVCFRGLRTFLGIDRVRTGFCGGASISPEVLLFFWILGVPVYQIYGMTESAGVSHTQRPGATTLGRSGPLIPGLEQTIAPDGELLLRGASVFKGYLFDEAATERAFTDGWLHTGDIVEIEVNGEAHVLDRKKDILITSGGKNITPSLIENALKDSPYIREAILLGDGRNFLSALIQIDLETTGKWAQESSIQYTTYRTLAQNEKVRELIAGEVKRVNERFARVENVRTFVILAKELDHDDGELTATMKVRRRIIEEKFAEEIAQIYGSAA
jgi:long-chain acyl-CoA synthetase